MGKQSTRPIFRRVSTTCDGRFVESCKLCLLVNDDRMFLQSSPCPVTLTTNPIVDPTVCVRVRVCVYVYLCVFCSTKHPKNHAVRLPRAQCVLKSAKSFSLRWKKRIVFPYHVPASLVSFASLFGSGLSFFILISTWTRLV